MKQFGLYSSILDNRPITAIYHSGLDSILVARTFPVHSFSLEMDSRPWLVPYHSGCHPFFLGEDTWIIQSAWTMPSALR